MVMAENQALKMIPTGDHHLERQKRAITMRKLWAIKAASVKLVSFPWKGRSLAKVAFRRIGFRGNVALQLL